MGKNKIGQFFSIATKNLPMSTSSKFTNHTVGKTCIKTLVGSGVSHNNVAQLSGHRSLKVTVYLQACLVYKQCRASGLSCRYLKPYIKLKLIGLAMRLYFSRLLNVSTQITFWMSNVRANFFFCLINVSLSFRAQSAKLIVCDRQIQLTHAWHSLGCLRCMKTRLPSISLQNGSCLHLLCESCALL